MNPEFAGQQVSVGRSSSRNERREIETLLAEVYDERFSDNGHHELFGDTGFSNFGLWTPETTCPVDASRNLVEELCRSYDRTTGSVLDVACGGGGTTACLAERFGAENVSAINISQRQVETTQRRVPGATVRRMSAVAMAFPPESFDLVICVEAAFHFETRARFFAEAFRVLKPGGTLVMSDILTRALPVQYTVESLSSSKPDPRLEVPLANHVTAHGYQELLDMAGFRNVTIKGVRNLTWEPFQVFVQARRTATMARIGAQGELRAGDLQELLSFQAAEKVRQDWDDAIGDYLLVSAKKR